MISIFASTMSMLRNHRHEKYCRLFAESGKGAESARGAGFAKASANVESARLQRDPVIMARIQQLLAADAKLIKITRAEALHEMSSLATFNIKDCYDEDGVLIPVHLLPAETAASIKEIKSIVIPAEYDGEGNITKPAEVVAGEIKAGHDKRAAIDMALRIHNAYEDHEGAGSGVINIYMDEKDMKA